MFIVAGGVKQVEFDTAKTHLSTKYLGVNYGVLSIMPTINRQISHKVKFGAGIDIAYDGSINAQVDISNDGQLALANVPFSDKVSLSVFGSFELVNNK